MTEAEAKTKWCPFVRFVFGATDYPAGNRFDGDSETAKDARAQSNCIGSACMAWRWKFGQPSDPPHEGDPGHCGLSGHPNPLFAVQPS